jgi:lipopolysaccharide transport system ATP-binding protein
MEDFALRTTDLGKMYRIGVEREKNPTLRDALLRAARRPIERIRHPGTTTHKTEAIWALRHVDMEVKYGEALGVIGRNGAGKSTLLKILSHITEPTEGKVEIRGRVGSLLEVGTGFHPELTGRENIQLNGAILGMSRSEIRSKFDDIVDFSEIGRFLDTPVKFYSSGMFVRLAFSVAAHLDPEILVLDEVLAVGDVAFQKKCLGKMEDVAREGRAVILVSHSPAAVTRLCHRTIVIESGRVIFDGECESAVRAYLRNPALAGTRQVDFADDPDLPISFRRIELSAKGKSGEDQLDIADALCFEIDYRVAADITGSNVGLSLKRDGTVLFSSWDCDTNNEPWQMRRAGDYSTRILLPSAFLCPGEYTVSLEAGQPGLNFHLQHNDCLTVELEKSIRYDSHHSHPGGGILMVALDWKTSEAAGD